jgi:hypothetical protein
MIKKTLLYATAIAASAMLLSAHVAQANPATPMSVIESSAVQLCGAVMEGMTTLQNRGLGEADGALAILIAIHHDCPQYEDLVMNTMGALAGEEACTKPT